MQHWPRSSIFMSQGIYSLIRPRRHAGADQDCLTAVCVTPLSTRPRIQQSCGLTLHERNRGLHFYPVCSSSCRRMASRYVRPPVVRRRCRETDPIPTRIAPPRARLARGSSQGELPVFYCCLLAMVGPWGSFLFPCP